MFDEQICIIYVNSYIYVIIYIYLAYLSKICVYNLVNAFTDETCIIISIEFNLSYTLVQRYLG